MLNEQLVDEADIVIAIFWNRLGSPTGEAESGTIEEIMRAHESGAYVGILRCERPAKQDESDLDQLKRLREYFDSIKGEALYLGYENAAGLTRHVEAILNQAVARGAAQLDQEPIGAPQGALVVPRVDRERYQDVDRQGRLKNRTRWRLVLVNEGTEAAREVTLSSNRPETARRACQRPQSSMEAIQSSRHSLRGAKSAFRQLCSAARRAWLRASFVGLILPGNTKTLPRSASSSGSSRLAET